MLNFAQYKRAKCGFSHLTTALLLMVFSSVPTLLADTVAIQISPNETKQLITLMGGDMERSAEMVLEAAESENILRWAFKDTGFNICRVKYDKHQEKKEGGKRFEFYDKQILAMKAVKKTNPDIKFFATQRSDYNGYKIGDRNNFPPWIYNMQSGAFDAKKHGRFLADFVIHMHKNDVPIHYLSTGKEITQVLDARLAIESIQAMHQRLDEANVPRPLMAEPCAWSIPQAIEFIQQVEKLGAQELFHAYTTHNYRNHGSADWQKFVEVAERAGAEAWNDESGMNHVDNGIAEPPFERILESMADRFGQYRAGIQGEIFFEIWSRGIGRETRPIYFQKGQRGIRMRAYYLMKQWAKSAFSSSVVETKVSDSSSIDAIAFKREKELFLWVINHDSNTPLKLKIDVLEEANVSKPLDYTLWSDLVSTEGSQRTIEMNELEELGMDIPSHSILILKLNLQ